MVFSAETYQNYLDKARAAQTANQHHDHRRALFLDFLRAAFEIETAEVQIEKYLRIDRRQKGWIDALFRDLVFEFKRDLGRERADGLRELRDYLRTLDHGPECVGLLTDGLIFEVYTLDDGGQELRTAAIDTVNLANTAPDDAFLWLDSYLFSQKNTRPTSADIVQRFGAHSPTFQAAAKTLTALLSRLRDNTTVQIKRRQWERLLAKAYGSEIGTDDLFVRHTFLNQFAKLLAFAALKDAPPTDDSELVGILTGEIFHQWGVSNLGEIDFFAWVLDDDSVRGDVIKMLRRLAESLKVYNLQHIDEDLLKQLYQNLVDPETRHDLGEFYTPDWLAELTLQEIDYRPGQSLLDPACGSGTFLFCAIRQLAAKGLTGWDLVNFALENVAGMDVHPLAVTIARINYLLAITPHMRGQNPSKIRLAQLPVYMADALQTPERTGKNKGTLVIPVDVERDEKFSIPTDAALAPAVFSEVINQMDAFARRPISEINTTLSNQFGEMVRQRFGVAQRGIVDFSVTYWAQNLKLLHKLIAEKRNSIWAYVLKNTARPLLLSAQKFDVIAGNPPWLTYKAIKDRTYQTEVRELAKGYGLVEKQYQKLATQLELSTLFMTHCEEVYLKPGGLIAFVMPRSTITGAKQHRLFQLRGLTRVLDLLAVTPLFNVPTAVLIKQLGQVSSDEVPTTFYKAQLPRHQLPLSEAQPKLSVSQGKTRFLGEVKSLSPYYNRVRQGAILVPRNLCFVKPQRDLNPGDAAFSPAMMSDPDLNPESKAPWKGISLRGLVYEENLYATLLSKNLMPFGYTRLHLVALPVRLGPEGKPIPMTETDFLVSGRIDSWEKWFEKAQAKWDELKKATSQLGNLIEQYNYQQNLTSQRLAGHFKVLYNTSGTNLSACVIDLNHASPNVYGYPTQGFVIDHKTYSMETQNSDEAHYLCAVLNSPFVDQAIKAHQSQGLFGERDIHRTPFEACAIPTFDAAHPDHMALARLSQAAHGVVSGTVLSGGVVKARGLARKAIQGQLAAIDEIARRVLG